jgi:UDP:flavonoid glycosyltransferase YjiC (YdhE family)
VFVVPSAPHAELLREAALLVMHAGHGITMKGLSAGVPMVCVPMGRDQGDNTARVVALGAGFKASPKATAAQLRATISNALASNELREAARRTAARFAERVGEVDVVELVEGLGEPVRVARSA